MPINSAHPQHEKFIDRWQRCRDAVEGQDAIKDAGETYLPRLSGHTRDFSGQKAYDAYKGRALWFGATDRTLKGYVGAIMRNDPSFLVPAIVEPRMRDITDAHQTAVQFAHTMVKELITTGRLGILVDKDAENAEELPYLRLYYPENILNWIIEDEVILALTLEETIYQPKDGDPYKLEPITQIRELHMKDGAYTVTIWQREKGADGELKETWTPISEFEPTFRGTPLQLIPFFFASADEDATSCSKPPILDLVDANINHYQLDADYRHGLHFTALPTAVFTGVDEGKSYYLGSEGALILRNSDAKAFFLEFQGLGLTAIKDAMEERKAQMASLGAQLLQRGQRGRGVETAEAARIQHSGETSLLATIVGRTEECLEQAIACMATWAGQPTDEEDVEVNMNRDFIDATLTAEEINSLVTSWQAGAITTDVLFWNFQRGGVIDPKVTIEDFKKAQEEEVAARQAAAVAHAGNLAAVKGSQDGSGVAEGTAPRPTGQRGVQGGSGASNTDGVSDQ